MSGAPGPTSSPLNGPLREANGERIALVEEPLTSGSHGVPEHEDAWALRPCAHVPALVAALVGARSYARWRPFCAPQRRTHLSPFLHSCVPVAALVALSTLLCATLVAALVSFAPLYTD
ncbi:hypothetical protein B0H13DRAFT_2319981 [Mycena leptocephala]|nr:hypothetical protein B0H13DRAFT_2319981 [Mycena leptocephala]